MNVVIRNATPNDWQIIQRLNNEVFKDNAKYDPFIKRNWAFSALGVTYYKKVTRDNSYVTLIAEVDGKPVGYLVGAERRRTYRSLKTAEIDNIGVSPIFRSKGIGKQLVHHFIHWAKSEGFTSLYVNAYDKNVRAIKFYQSLGMKPIDMSLEMRI